MESGSILHCDVLQHITTCYDMPEDTPINMPNSTTTCCNFLQKQFIDYKHFRYIPIAFFPLLTPTRPKPFAPLDRKP